MGHFPNSIRFPENTIDGINMSMMLHFLPPDTIEGALKEMFSCLKKGGSLSYHKAALINTHLRTLLLFIQQKLLNQHEWPGDIPDIAQYVPQRAHLLPKRNIVFCIHELTRLVTKFGFHVHEAVFFSEEIPADLALDGREYSGIICEKPKDSSFAFLRRKVRYFRHKLQI